MCVRVGMSHVCFADISCHDESFRANENPWAHQGEAKKHVSFSHGKNTHNEFFMSKSQTEYWFISPLLSLVFFIWCVCYIAVLGLKKSFW